MNVALTFTYYAHCTDLSVLRDIHLVRLSMDSAMAPPSDFRFCVVFSLSTLFSALFILGSLNAIKSLWWTPRYFRRFMEKQGIKGPPPRFLVGNSPEIFRTKPDPQTFVHDHANRLLDFYMIWSQIYGKRHLFWWGCEPRLVVTEMELLKQIFAPKNALLFGKPHSSGQKVYKPLMGNGLAIANGESWAHQRKLVAPAFRFDELKGLAGEMARVTETMLNMWDSRFRYGGNREAEFDVAQEFKRLTADIIARTQFGSNYEKGRKVFEDLDRLKALIVRFDVLDLIPVGRFFPTPLHLQKWRLSRDIERALKEIVQERRNRAMPGESKSFGGDLLGLMLGAEAAEDREEQLTTQEIIDECKTFFFAGHDTTSSLLTWVVLLLAAYPEWQERARAEVADVCGREPPDATCLGGLKVLGMILNETLRLYPAISVSIREAEDGTMVGNLFIPRGLCLWIPILAIHVDKELWGKDAMEFNPERFVEGIGKASKHPMAFQAFSLGPRNCVGQNFAIMEAKIVLAMLLSHFKFKMSPNYKHSPEEVVILRPKYGAPVIIEKLHPN